MTRVRIGTPVERLTILEGLLSGLRFEFNELDRRVTAHMKEEEEEKNVLARIEVNLAGNTDRTNEMYALFQAASAGLRVIGGFGRAVSRCIHFLGRIARPLFWIVALVGAAWTGVTTGHFALPAWLEKLP